MCLSFDTSPWFNTEIRTTREVSACLFHIPHCLLPDSYWEYPLSVQSFLFFPLPQMYKVIYPEISLSGEGYCMVRFQLIGKKGFTDIAYVWGWSECIHQVGIFQIYLFRFGKLLHIILFGIKHDEGTICETIVNRRFIFLIETYSTFSTAGRSFSRMVVMTCCRRRG